MGGYGSGRTGWRPTIERTSAVQLDVNAIMRAAHQSLTAGQIATLEELEDIGTLHLEWRRPEPWGLFAKAALSIHLASDHGEAMIRYEVDHAAGRVADEQRVRLVAAPCHLGGVRWFWICPEKRRRVVKLYLPNGGRRFLSRTAYRLAYASQAEAPIDRSHGAFKRLHGKLGGQYRHFGDPLPKKPKWMRWRTYWRLRAEWTAAMARHDAIFEAGASKLLERLRKVEKAA